ncbi:asparaginase [Flindersiella endophytica]
MSDAPVLAEVVRSGFVEARHRGAVIALSADGSVAFALGDVGTPIYPRSSNKPMQAVGMLRANLDVKDELLALVSASHSGEDFHVDGVRRILAQAGLAEDALQCPPDWPADEATKHRLVRAGEEPSRIRMNCSGKHSGMLAACVAARWDTRTYLEPAHPLQNLLRRTIEELTGEPVAHTGVDGCGAPLFAFSLIGLATAFRTIALAPVGTPEQAVATAIRTHPEWTSGTTRDEAALIRGVPGLFGKGGAEACYAVALDDGRTVALKIEDGGGRARQVVMAAALRKLGVSAPVIEEQLTAPVRGGGRQVGEIRAVLSA